MEALNGIDVILLYGLLKKETQEAAWKMAFQTEHENGLSRDSDSTVTKDGNVQTLSPVEYDFSATSIVAKGDTHVDEMKQALLNGDIIEIWEIIKQSREQKTMQINIKLLTTKGMYLNLLRLQQQKTVLN